MSTAQSLQWLPQLSDRPAVYTITATHGDDPRAFEIIDQLGAGGFGKVYRAWDRQRARVVALKVLTVVNGDSLFRFKKEFRSLVGLSHPNLVTLYELLSDGEDWFFTMELVEGVDFSTYVTRNPESGLHPRPTFDIRPPARRDGPPPLSHTFDEWRLRETLRQLAEGIQALHDAGKLHRDVKPTNLLVSRSGRVKLLDFGLVTELDGYSSGNQVAGTVEYMAPEQAYGAGESAATDWYSVGVMLYQALTGALPYEGTWMQVVLDKRGRPPRPPGELAPSAPTDLCELCQQLLNPEPHLRPTGDDVLEAFGAGTTHHRSTSPMSEQLDIVDWSSKLPVLRSAFAGSKAGRRPVVAHVTGPGRTALVKHFVSELPGSTVLSGRCCSRETVPYKAFDGLMDALATDLRRRSRAEVKLLLPPDAWVLGVMFPVLQRVSAINATRPPSGLQLEPREQTRHAVQALCELLARMAARSPLVLVIDDLQWGDPASISLLRDLVRHELPLLLVLCYRIEEQPESQTLRALQTVGESRRTVML